MAKSNSSSEEFFQNFKHQSEIKRVQRTQGKIRKHLALFPIAQKCPDDYLKINPIRELEVEINPKGNLGPEVEV